MIMRGCTHAGNLTNSLSKIMSLRILLIFFVSIYIYIRLLFCYSFNFVLPIFDIFFHKLSLFFTLPTHMVDSDSLQFTLSLLILNIENIFKHGIFIAIEIYKTFSIHLNSLHHEGNKFRLIMDGNPH